jgi:hypothetical protein
MDDAAIATHYHLDPAQPAPLQVGGLRAFAALDRREPGRRLIAVATRADQPLRARMVARLGLNPVANALVPVDQGLGRDPAGQENWFMLCAAPPGPPLAPAGWTEALAVRHLLLPAAAALETLAQRGVTHRAIRPDNVFRAGPGEPVTLGPFWATPPASLQPAAFEPPYSAMCAPGGRGEGTGADDVYALGAVILWCLLGGPAAWADPGMQQRKLEIDSLPALCGGIAPAGGLFELLRLMLAEDPDHRPTPAVLLAPDQAQTRRLATRPPRRAKRPLDLAGHAILTPRQLAQGLAARPERGVAMIRDGTVDRWLRRMLGDGELAVHVQETMETEDASEKGAPRRDAVMLMRAVWVLDPLAPLVWRGLALFPDGLAGALVAAQASGQAAALASLEELVVQDMLLHWSMLQTKRPDLPAMRQDMIDWRGWLSIRGPMGGIRRLAYGLNPLLPCASPLLAGRVVARLADLLPALDAAAARADRKRLPADPHIAAFVGARADTALLADGGRVDGFTSAPERLAVLQLFARLQARLHPAPLPGLAGWLLECGLIELEQWRGLDTRRALKARLAEAAAAGNITAMFHLAQDEAAQQADRAGAAAAAARAATIAHELAVLAASAPRRQAAAEELAYSIAGGAGLLAMLAAGVAVGMGL